MNELDTFTIKFVTEGIDKLLDGMDKLNKQMDKVDSGFTKAGSKGDSLFGKFVGWGTKIAGLIGGIYGIGKAINDTINSSNEILTLNKTADEVGHTAKEIEVLGLTLQRFSPNLSLASAYGQAGNFYKALNDLRLNESRLSPNSALMEELNRSGSSAILATDSDQEIVRKLRVGVQNYLNTQSPEMASASIEKLLSAAGISYKDMGGLFKASDADFNFIMGEMNKRAWRYDPKYQQEAQNLAEARLQLSETWKKMTDQMMPIVTRITQDFTKLVILIKPIIELLLDGINVFVKTLEWIGSKFSWLWNWGKSNVDTGRAKWDLVHLEDLINGKGADWTVEELNDAINRVTQSLGKGIDPTDKTLDILAKATSILQDYSVNPLNTVGTAGRNTSNLKIEYTQNNNVTTRPQDVGSVVDNLGTGGMKGTIDAANNASIIYGG
jgi:hypothetical protein